MQLSEQLNKAAGAWSPLHRVSQKTGSLVTVPEKVPNISQRTVATSFITDFLLRVAAKGF